MKRRKDCILYIGRNEVLVEEQADWERIPSSCILRADEPAPQQVGSRFRLAISVTDVVLDSLQRMLERIPYVTRSRCHECLPADEWVDASETIILIGQAAHPMLVRAFDDRIRAAPH